MFALLLCFCLPFKYIYNSLRIKNFMFKVDDLIIYFNNAKRLISEDETHMRANEILSSPDYFPILVSVFENFDQLSESGDILFLLFFKNYIHKHENMISELHSDIFIKLQILLINYMSDVAFTLKYNEYIYNIIYCVSRCTFFEGAFTFALQNGINDNIHPVIINNVIILTSSALQRADCKFIEDNLVFLQNILSNSVRHFIIILEKNMDDPDATLARSIYKSSLMLFSNIIQNVKSTNELTEVYKSYLNVLLFFMVNDDTEFVNECLIHIGNTITENLTCGNLLFKLIDSFDMQTINQTNLFNYFLILFEFYSDDGVCSGMIPVEHFLEQTLTVISMSFDPMLGYLDQKTFSEKYIDIYFDNIEVPMQMIRQVPESNNTLFSLLDFVYGILGNQFLIQETLPNIVDHLLNALKSSNSSLIHLSLLLITDLSDRFNDEFHSINEIFETIVSLANDIFLYEDLTKPFIYCLSALITSFLVPESVAPSIWDIIGLLITSDRWNGDAILLIKDFMCSSPVFLIQYKDKVREVIERGFKSQNEYILSRTIILCGEYLRVFPDSHDVFLLLTSVTSSDSSFLDAVIMALNRIIDLNYNITEIVKFCIPLVVDYMQNNVFYPEEEDDDMGSEVIETGTSMLYFLRKVVVKYKETEIIDNTFVRSLYDLALSILKSSMIFDISLKCLFSICYHFEFDLCQLVEHIDLEELLIINPEVCEIFFKEMTKFVKRGKVIVRSEGTSTYDKPGLYTTEGTIKLLVEISLKWGSCMFSDECFSPPQDYEFYSSICLFIYHIVVNYQHMFPLSLFLETIFSGNQKKISDVYSFIQPYLSFIASSIIIYHETSAILKSFVLTGLRDDSELTGEFPPYNIVGIRRLVMSHSSCLNTNIELVIERVISFLDEDYTGYSYYYQTVTSCLALLLAFFYVNPELFINSRFLHIVLGRLPIVSSMEDDAEFVYNTLIDIISSSPNIFENDENIKYVLINMIKLISTEEKGLHKIGIKRNTDVFNNICRFISNNKHVIPESGLSEYQINILNTVV